MTAKTICAKHELAHPIDERCPYCTGPNRIVSCEPVEPIFDGSALEAWLGKNPKDAESWWRACAGIKLLGTYGDGCDQVEDEEGDEEDF